MLLDFLIKNKQLCTIFIKEFRLSSFSAEAEYEL